MFNVCCVVGCNSRRNVVNLFKFRKTELGLQNWLKCIPGEFRGQSDDVLRKFYVCAKHFEKRFFSSKSRLHLGAYPTLFTDDEIASGLSNALIENMNDSSFLDHDYSNRRKHNDHNYCKNISRIRFSESSSTQTLPVSSPIIQTAASSSEMDSLPSTAGQQPLSSNMDDSCLLTIESSLTQNQPLLTPKTLRHRDQLVNNKASLTPHCKRLYQKYKRSQKQLNFQKRAKRALKFRKDKSIAGMLQNMNPLARKILRMQINQSNKKIKGRRFTIEEKLISLCIMKQSPNSYGFLQKIFILPSKQTLNKFTSGLANGTGINLQIINTIQEEVTTWEENKKSGCKKGGPKK